MELEFEANILFGSCHFHLHNTSQRTYPRMSTSGRERPHQREPVERAAENSFAESGGGRSQIKVR
jgi:hypothetical protein